MLEFKFVLLLLAAASYPKFTLKEDPTSAIPIQNSESQTVQTKFSNNKEKYICQYQQSA